MLNNVKRTEDSLLKLKRNRRSVQVEQLAEGMSDDNKIRLQLSIDIGAYAKEVCFVCLFLSVACLTFSFFFIF